MTGTNFTILDVDGVIDSDRILYERVAIDWSFEQIHEALGLVMKLQWRDGLGEFTCGAIEHPKLGATIFYAPVGRANLGCSISVEKVIGIEKIARLIRSLLSPDLLIIDHDTNEYA